MADDKPIIVIKKKGGHGGHHGGAWKVAYADFVTAMMAFFMVMWLVNSAETKTKSAIASYFRRPGLFESGSGTPLLIGGAGILPDAYAPNKPNPDPNTSAGADGREDNSKGLEGEKRGPFNIRKPDKPVEADGIVSSDEQRQGVKVKNAKEGGALELADQITVQKKRLEELAKSLEKTIREIPEFKELLGLIEVKVEADGLTIDIMDTEKASMFRSGSAQIRPASIAAFEKVSGLLKSLPNQIEIMGHTDAKPFSTRGGMSNWELSADRANAARRVLEQQGVPGERITSVVGRADKELRFPAEPFNPSNRRISLKVKFDLDKITGTPPETAALNDFKQMFPETFSQSSSAESAPSGEVSSEQALPVETAAPTPLPTKAVEVKLNEAYAPQVAISAVNEKKNTITLPDEKPAEDQRSSSPAKIFRDDPVVGPINPFFNN